MTRWRWWRIGLGVLLGLLAAGGGLAVRGWLDPWSPRLVIRPPGETFGWGIAPDGRALQVSGHRADDGVQVLSDVDLATGRPLTDRPEPLVPMRSYAADGRSYVGLSTDRDRAVVRVDVASGAVTGRYVAEPFQSSWPTRRDGGRSVRAYLHDGDRVAEVATWDTATYAVSRRPFNGPPDGGRPLRVVQATQDRRTLIYADSRNDGVQLWDGELDRPIGGLLRTPTTRIAQQVQPEVTPDGRTLVVPRDDGQVDVWAIPEGRLVRTVRVHPAGFRSFGMALSPDGRVLASGAADSTATTGLASAWARMRDLSPALHARSTREVVVVDLATARRLARFPGEGGPLITPDGRTLVTQDHDGSYPVRTIPASHPASPLSEPGPAGPTGRPGGATGG